MFAHRAETYGAKVLFEMPDGTGLTWRQAAGRVEVLARGLIGLAEDGEPGPVAILSENRLEMALVDLACLTSGIVNVLIPANATAQDVGFMLAHARVRTVIVSSPEQLRKVQDCRGAAEDGSP